MIFQLFDVPVERRLRAAFAGNADGLRLIAVLVGHVHSIAAGTQLDRHERAERIGSQHLVVVCVDDLDVCQFIGLASDFLADVTSTTYETPMMTMLSGNISDRACSSHRLRCVLSGISVSLRNAF